MSSSTSKVNDSESMMSDWVESAADEEGNPRSADSLTPAEKKEETAAVKVLLDEAKAIMAEAEAMKAEATAVMKEAQKNRVEVTTALLEIELEKASMERAHAFQKNKIKLNVGGYRFETSLQTLTSVPGTYFSSLFSGRFPLTPDEEDGSYFIDRSGRHFNYVLDYLRDPTSFVAASSSMTESIKRELAVEAGFYGLLELMMPFLSLDHIGRLLLQRAYLNGTRADVKIAVSQARDLVFDVEESSMFLSAQFSDLRFIITEQFVNGSPVWAAGDGLTFMYRTTSNRMMISVASSAVDGVVEADGTAPPCLYNSCLSPLVNAPSDLPSNMWVSNEAATSAAQFASASRLSNGNGELVWAEVPEFRIHTVHGLRDDDVAMAKAINHLSETL